jgi:FkbM family methyltransferase
LTARRLTPKFDDLVYDVGMHKGEDSVFYLAKGFRVVGIEADPDLARHCRERFETEIERGRMTIVEGAIVDPRHPASAHTVRFFKNDENSVWGTAQENWSERNARRGASSTPIEVAAIRFADVIREHGVPHYMKIDIEGNDVFCLAALAGFEERPDYVSIEASRTGFAGVMEEIERLESLGYDAFQAIEQASIPRVQRPPQPSREGDYVAHRFEAGSSGLFGAELPGRWRTRREILRRYRAIGLGTWLFDPDGLTRAWERVPGVKPMRAVARRLVTAIVGSPVPGWYDTHARHRSVSAPPHQV